MLGTTSVHFSWDSWEKDLRFFEHKSVVGNLKSLEFSILHKEKDRLARCLVVSASVP